VPHQNLCQDALHMETSYIAGTPYVGTEMKMHAGPGGHRGEFCAWDPARAQKIWSVKERFPVWSGALATAGDVVFYGTMDGWFKAVDARTCAELWKFHTGSGIVGNPITYQVNGKQFVAVYSGVGGWMGAVAFPDLSTDDPYAALGVVGAVPDIKMKTGLGGTLYVFGL
jgi:alcohol dehydrogenase (cytochrome c)